MFKISDRIKESSSTTGTGSVVLGGAIGAFQTFSDGIGNGNTTYYVIENYSRWEVGQGVYSSATNSLSRDVVFSSSSGGSKITLEGASVVFCALPSSKAFLKDPDFNVSASGFIGTKLDVSSGILSSGMLTLVRPDSAGNFIHAYRDDSDKKTIALHINDQASPTWTLGLKNNPNSNTASPTLGYVYAREGAAGLVSSSTDYIALSRSEGFSTYNKSHFILKASSDTGVYIDGKATAYPVLTVQGAPLTTSDLQVWEKSDGTQLASIGNDGALSTSGIKVSGINLPSYIPPSTTNILYNDNGTLRFNGSVIGGEGDVTSEDISAVSGIATQASGVAATALQNIVEDTTPQLGGDLDTNGSNITRSSAGDLTITTSDGNLVLDPSSSIRMPVAGFSTGRMLYISDSNGTLSTNSNLNFNDSTGQISTQIVSTSSLIVSTSSIQVSLDSISSTENSVVVNNGGYLKTKEINDRVWDDLKRKYNNVSSDFSMSSDSDVVFLDTSSSSLNVYLPTAIGQGGKELTIKLKSGSNSGVLIASGSQTVDGQAQFPLRHTLVSVTLISDNSNWFLI